MATGNRPDFVLIQRDGYREDELFEADTLQEIADYLNGKSGGGP